jgi:hypothetical protein
MISHQQIRDAVQRSGYLLEYRIEQVLRRHYWAVQSNQAYPDPVTGKARELDLAAIGAEAITQDWRNILWPRLLIECANNPQPMAFFSKTAEAPTAHMYELKFSGLPMRILAKGRWSKLAEFLGMESYHHHCKGRVSTQYCSFTPKKGTQPVQWLAQHEDSHFDSFNKLCFALNHDIDDHYSHTKLRGRETINVQMYYPVLVLAGQIVDISPTRKELKLRSTKHIHYIQSYITAGREQQYHIDVVTEKYFPFLLRQIRNEIEHTARLVRQRKKVVQTSVDEITRSVRGLRSKDAIRERLEM